MGEENWRNREREQIRINQILGLIPNKGKIALDVGARDGYISWKLTDYFDKVVALDLEKPDIEYENVEPVAGDVTNLQFEDNSFDLVLCAEVLEHIPTDLLAHACNELSRITSDSLIIGVPYKQDTRKHRTTCPSCRRPNPPWGHVNVFDETRLAELFAPLSMNNFEFIGTNEGRTNFISTFLLDLAGNPLGSYRQQEKCIYCNSEITRDKEMTFTDRVLVKLATIVNKLQPNREQNIGNWIHAIFRKKKG